MQGDSLARPIPLLPAFMHVTRSIAMAAALSLALAVSASSDWQRGGNRVCSGDWRQDDIRAVSDGSGGAIVAWVDHRTYAPAIYVQRITANGTIGYGWPAEGLLVTPITAEEWHAPYALVSDGAGGAILTWAEGGIRALHVTPSGYFAPVWPTSGMQISAVGSHPEAAEDGSGGAIIAFFDGASLLRVQRVDRAGGLHWQDAGILLSSVVAYGGLNLWVAPDNVGGAVVAWFDELDGLLQARAQHVDSSGTIRPGWDPDGVIVPHTGTALITVADSAGGAIVSCCPISPGNPPAVAGVTAGGQLSWTWDPAEAQSGPFGCPWLVSDARGGAIVVFPGVHYGQTDELGMFAQRLSPGGSRLWQPGGIKIATELSVSWGQIFFVVPDGVGGALTAFYHWGPPDDQEGVSVARIGSDGAVPAGWPESGVIVAERGYNGRTLSLVASGDGAALVFWGVARDQFDFDGTRLYVQKVAAGGGAVGVEPSARPTEFRLLPVAPNPSRDIPSITYTVPRDTRIRLSLEDVQGRRVAMLADERVVAGRHSLNLGRTNMPPGLYFVRLQWPGGSASRRFVLTR